MEDAERQVARKLDEIVGGRFREDAHDPARRWRNTIAKWVIAAAAAVGAAASVVYLIESHRLPAQPVTPVQKPVTVEILPARKP
jgi:hypothetical protein